MEADTVSVLIGVLAFIVSIVVTLVGVSWRLRGVIEKSVEEELQKHVDGEHGKDGEGRTIRERVGLVEQSVKTLYKWKDQVIGRSPP